MATDSFTSFIDTVLASQDNPLVDRNQAERDGNSGVALFTIDQAAISLSGGNTVQAALSDTTINPAKGLDDLTSGKFSLNALLLLVIGWLAYKFATSK